MNNRYKMLHYYYYYSTRAVQTMVFRYSTDPAKWVGMHIRWHCSQVNYDFEHCHGVLSTIDEAA